jgi:hypothetical protein
VLIDNVYHGSTPLIVEEIEPGIYGVTFSRFGYAKLFTPVRVESGKTTEVSGKLISVTGSLDITTSPAWARILLDAVNLGITTVSRPNMTAGNHTLTVVKEGYVTAEQRERFSRIGQRRSLSHSSPYHRPLWNTLRAAGPAPATLIAGFIMILLAIRLLRI